MPVGTGVSAAFSGAVASLGVVADMYSSFCRKVMYDARCCRQQQLRSATAASETFHQTCPRPPWLMRPTFSLSEYVSSFGGAEPSGASEARRQYTQFPCVH